MLLFDFSVYVVLRASVCCYYMYFVFNNMNSIVVTEKNDNNTQKTI